MDLSTIRVPSGTTSPCSRGNLMGIVRELARTPLIGRLCPSRELVARHPTALLPVLKLPETLLAVVFSLGGLSATLNASLTCRPAYVQLWQSPLFWRTLLQNLGVSDFELRDAGLEGGRDEGRLAAAKALRDFARHWLLGIDILGGMAATSALRVARQSPYQIRSVNLEDARRAVLAMRQEDGNALIQRAVESMANLLRSRSCGEIELSKAEALLEAVATRSDIFSTAQMLDMLGAHQQADEDHDLLVTMPKHPTTTLQSSQVACV